MWWLVMFFLGSHKYSIFWLQLQFFSQCCVGITYCNVIPFVFQNLIWNDFVSNGNEGLADPLVRDLWPEVSVQMQSPCPCDDKNTCAGNNSLGGVHYRNRSLLNLDAHPNQNTLLAQRDAKAKHFRQNYFFFSHVILRRSPPFLSMPGSQNPFWLWLVVRGNYSLRPCHHGIFGQNDCDSVYNISSACRCHLHTLRSFILTFRHPLTGSGCVSTIRFSGICIHTSQKRPHAWGCAFRTLCRRICISLGLRYIETCFCNESALGIADMCVCHSEDCKDKRLWNHIPGNVQFSYTAECFLSIFAICFGWRSQKDSHMAYAPWFFEISWLSRQTSNTILHM